MIVAAVAKHKDVNMRHLIFKILISSVACGYLCSAIASPVPAQGSSVLADQSNGYFLGSIGFTLKTPSTNWVLENSNLGGIASQGPQLLYRGIQEARVSVHTDRLQNDLTLENYAKKWMRDYNHYGFDVLGSKAFSLGDANSDNKPTRGLVIDLLQKKLNKQMRQVIFLQAKNVVVMSCQDEQKQFSKTLADCNQMAKSFQWVENLTPANKNK